MYSIKNDEVNGMLNLEVSGDVSRQDYNDILSKLDTIISNSSIKYKVLLVITKYNFYFWQLSYIMKIKRLAASSNVDKMAIVIDEDFSRRYGIRPGVQEYKNQVVFYTMSEANDFLGR